MMALLKQNYSHNVDKLQQKVAIWCKTRAHHFNFFGT